jgi:hypothetical protein
MKPRIYLIFILFIAILFAGDAFAQTNVISTVAGNGSAGFSGDGGQATSAQLNAPFGVAVDSAGNFYIAEWSNHRVRKVDTSGVITTFAGIGIAGYGGDGGPATQAALNSPEGVAVDSAGNVYIADSFNNRIRKVDTSGTITTIAGNGQARYTGEGVATDVGLNDPSGVAVDNSGNVYIADNSAHRIRKVSGGTISTIAGTGVGGYSGDGGPAVAAQVYNPTHLTVDGSGNIYIADYSNNRVRKVNTAGIITTVAGTATFNNQGGYSGDGGPATSAQFNKPAGVAIDSSGNLYIADADNKRVRRVDAGTGIVTTLAGGGKNGDGCNSETAALGFPIDVALTPSKNQVYIVDYADNRIRMIMTAKNGSVPAISSISPSSGVSGRNYQVTLSGSGFVVGGGSASCTDGTTTLGITGSGVTLSGESIANNTISVTFTVASDAPAASHDVTVTNSFGTSNAVKFSVGLPTPTITSISPSSGLRGTNVTVTMTGTNFVSGSGTAVTISSGGVTASNVNVQSDTSLTATFNIGSAATMGAYFVSVSTPNGGGSNTVQFSVSSSTPTITSISPSSGVRGASTQITIKGTNFAASSPTVKVSPSGITVSNVSVTSDTSITATLTVSPTANLGNYFVWVASSAGGGSNNVTFAVNPQGPTITFAMPRSLNPTQQVPVQLTLPNAQPDEVDGVVTLTFNPTATSLSDDASVTFVGTQASPRSLSFAFKSNTTTAIFDIDNVVLQAGTVAGTIRLTLDSVKVAGQPVTPNNSTFDITIPLLPPVITNVRLLNRTSGGFDVEITGYSTSREITQATFQFTAGSGGTLATAQLQPDVASTFTTYYQSDASAAVGSAFVYTQPFIAQQGDANVVTSISVTLTNSQGTSDPKTAP